MWTTTMKSFLAVDFLATLGLLVNYVQLIGFSFRNCQFFVNRYFSSYCSLHQCVCLFVCVWCKSPQWTWASSFMRFLDHTQQRITVGRTPLNKWSVRRRDLYLTTHNTHNRQTTMSPVGFEPTISAGEWPQTYALDCAATGIAMH